MYALTHSSGAREDLPGVPYIGRIALAAVSGLGQGSRMSVVVPWRSPSALDAVLRLSARPGLCWLDGDAPHADGRWSFVAADPVEWLRVDGDASDPLASLAALETPAFAAGEVTGPARAAPRWVGHVAYDAFHAGRRRRHQRGSDALVAFARYDAVLAIDHASREAWLVADDAAACERLATALAAPLRTPRACAGAAVATPPDAHLAAIARALEHVAAGDIYQVNLARRFVAPFAGDPLALFLAMLGRGAVPFGFFQRDGARALLGRSMERFLRWQRNAGVLETRPIKGTIARRGGHDASEAAALRADPKEQAEHAMIVDLMRNDLGRVARFGSVEVRDVMTVEPFAGLSHLVSTVRCRTRADLTLPELLGATFPPGSVTGTPKLRAIEIIEALEPAARGAYTGAVGFVDRAGDLSLSVAIRTASVEGDRACYWAGGGIVEASVPERELAETELKAQVFLQALEQLAAGEPRALPEAPPLLY